MKNMRKKRGWFREGPALTSPSSAFMRNLFHDCIPFKGDTLKYSNVCAIKVEGLLRLSSLSLTLFLTESYNTNCFSF